MKGMKSMTEIECEGRRFPVVLTRKAMRRITIKPEPGRLIVHAPIGVPLSIIKSTVTKHWPKLKPLLIKDEAISSRHVYFLGHKAGNHDAYLSTIFPDPLDDYLAADFQKELRKKAELFFTKRIRHYERVMGVDRPYEVVVRKMKGRLGSNNKTRHSITLALRLIHYAIPIIDAVVVHELAHHFAFDHSKKFYEILTQYYPDYRSEHDKILKGQYR
jgi:predicted metal-dependent hydrolase